MDFIKKIEKLVEKNSIDDALNELERLVATNYFDLQKEIVLLKSRANDIQRRRIKGIIDFKEEQIEINQIKDAILTILGNIRDEQRNNFNHKIQINVVEKNRRPTILNEYLNLLRVRNIIPLIITCGLIYGFVMLIKTDQSLKLPSRKANFIILIDKNKFNEAELYLDSIYLSDPSFQREEMRQEIFNRKIDVLWNQNKIDSILSNFRNYSFRYIFPEEVLSHQYIDDYNQEATWYNTEIEKLTSRFCKIDKMKAYFMINSYFRPKAVIYEVKTGEKTKCYRDFARKTILADLVNKCN